MIDEKNDIGITRRGLKKGRRNCFAFCFVLFSCFMFCFFVCFFVLRCTYIKQKRNVEVKNKRLVLAYDFLNSSAWISVSS